MTKTIHYCWFGGAPLPDEYIKSWQKYLPDYKIKRWDESNFDINCCDYVREAYAAKKWAFVSDYARIKIIYENGGIYFDTDVELIKPPADIVNGAFMGLERNHKNVGINLGLGFGAPAGTEILKELLQYYNSIHFDSRVTVVTHVSGIFKRYGFNFKDELQTVAGVTLYPSEYLSPIDSATHKMTVTPKTVSIHHFAASWQSGGDKYKTKIKKLLGPTLTRFLIAVKQLFKKENDN